MISVVQIRTEQHIKHFIIYYCTEHTSVEIWKIGISACPFNFAKFIKNLRESISK